MSMASASPEIVTFLASFSAEMQTLSDISSCWRISLVSDVGSPRKKIPSFSYMNLTEGATANGGIELIRTCQSLSVLG